MKRILDYLNQKNNLRFTVGNCPKVKWGENPAEEIIDKSSQKGKIFSKSFCKSKSSLDFF